MRQHESYSLRENWDQPFSISINPSTNKAYVVNYGDNTVSVIDSKTNRVIDAISVGM